MQSVKVKSGRFYGAITLALAVLAGCGSDEPVSGSAEPVPEPTPQPQPVPVPPVPPTLPERFTSVAPDPYANPSYLPSPAVEYQLGYLPVSGGASSHYVFLAPVKGWIRMPQAALSLSRSQERFPIVVFLHGNHTPKDPSYRGYDYLARHLAEQGYVVVSIDANEINGSFDNPVDPTKPEGDQTSVSRAQLILGTLDRLREIDAVGGPGMLAGLQGRLDFDRIGLMGHSRGGQGVANAIKQNLQRRSVGSLQLQEQLIQTPALFEKHPALLAALTSTGGLDEQLYEQALVQDNIFFSPFANTVKPYSFKAAMLLAPTDFFGNVGLANVPLAVVLPSCDGDVLQLQGARTYDNNRFGFEYDTAERFQVLTKGANHNFYNTEWVYDDTNLWAKDPYCDSKRDNAVHLTAEDQRRAGLFIINSFMRYFVGDEQAFGPYWNGLAQLPPAACPEGVWPCDSQVVLTVQEGSARYLPIQTFEQIDSLRYNNLGGGVALSGFDATAWCQMPYGGSSTVGSCWPYRLPGFEYDPERAGGLRSIAEQAQLIWSNPGATFAMGLNGISARSYDTLSFRIAVVRPFGQEVLVTLTDTSGRSATLEGSRFSDALYLGLNPPVSGSPLVADPEDLPWGDGQVDQVLSMVALPLSAFEGVALDSLAEVSLKFPAQSGSVALADVQFQALGR